MLGQHHCVPAGAAGSCAGSRGGECVDKVSVGVASRERKVQRPRLVIRGQLCEAAWSYNHVAHIGAGLAERQKGVPPATVARSWSAQSRLCRRFRSLAARKNVKSVVATAVARELAGFLWAEMTAAD